MTETAKRNIARAQLVNSVIQKYSDEHNVSTQLVKNGCRTPRVLKARNAAICELSARRWSIEKIAKVFNLSPVTVYNIHQKARKKRRDATDKQ